MSWGRCLKGFSCISWSSLGMPRSDLSDRLWWNGLRVLNRIWRNLIIFLRLKDWLQGMKDCSRMWGGHHRLHSRHAIVLISKDGGRIQNLHRLLFYWMEHRVCGWILLCLWSGCHGYCHWPTTQSHYLVRVPIFLGWVRSRGILAFPFFL